MKMFQQLQINKIMIQEDKDKLFEKMDEIRKDGYILESLDNVNFPKVYNKPPCDLTVPADKVEEINLPKPFGEIFWNEFNYDTRK